MMRPQLWAAAWAVVVSGAASPALAQDAVQGRRLFVDTINTSGVNTLTGNCISCHGSVENRRLKIGGSRYAEISPALASDRFRVAVASVSAMQQFEALSAEQVQHLAAYLADTPRVSEAQLDFTASAVNTVTAPKSVQLAHAVATAKTLRVVSVAVEGLEAARFSRSADGCDAQTLASSGTCAVSVQFAARDKAGTSASLVFTLQESGSSETFTRSVALNGAVAPSSVPAPPPAEAPASASDSGGGGAVVPGWAAALALAVLALQRANWRAARRARRQQGDTP
jgi:mono/diheme cytochrome c family protein